MFEFLEHVFKKHLAPTLVILILVVFGLGVNKTLAPVSVSDEFAQQNLPEDAGPNILALRTGPALFDVQIGPVQEPKKNNWKFVPFGIVGLILLVAAIYAFIYNKIH